jgi:hypothetical protein
MDEHQHKTANERRADERRVLRIALLVSALVHVFLILSYPSVEIPPSPFAAAGPRAGDSRAAGGGMQSVTLSPPRPRIIRPPAVPLISLDVTDPIDFDPDPEVDLSSLLGEGAGRLPGPPGIEGGTGRGDGGTAAEGLFRMVPPSPRGMIIPPTNDRLRGRQVEVWVFVDATGRVVADSTRLNPPTSDRGFNRRLIQEAAEWVFNPAMQGGQPVAAWFPYTISMD